MKVFKVSLQDNSLPQRSTKWANFWLVFEAPAPKEPGT